MIAQETWSNLAALTADLGKMRGELSRMRRGVEELRLPAIEAVGLDKVVEAAARAWNRGCGRWAMCSTARRTKGVFERVLKDLLVVIDTLDRVFELAEQQPGSVSEGVMRGLSSVYDLLLQTLGRHGLQPMEIGQAFDPHQQMAMGTEPNPELAGRCGEPRIAAGIPVERSGTADGAGCRGEEQVTARLGSAASAKEE